MDDPTTFGIRLTNDELMLIKDAAEASKEPGDRGGSSSWARRVLLKEAKRVVDEKPCGEES